MPAISIVMAAFDAEEYLAETLRTLLGQTFGDFELIIVDDGSTDRTAEIIANTPDKRIRYLRNPQNSGVAHSANRGLEAANGKYVARADSDDLYAPNRLQAQWDFMEANPQVALSSGDMRYLGNGSGNGNGAIKLPPDAESIKAALPFYCPIMQPVAIMRNSFIHAHSLRYDEALYAASDYDLWFRITHWHDGVCANIPVTLAQYRVHEKSISTSKALTQQAMACRVRRRHFTDWGLPMNDHYDNLHNLLYLNARPENAELVNAMREWLTLLLRQNEASPRYSALHWQEIVARKFFDFCARSLQHPQSQGFASKALKQAISFPGFSLAGVSVSRVEQLMREAVTAAKSE